MKTRFSLTIFLWTICCHSVLATNLQVKGTVVATPCIVNSNTVSKQIEMPKTEARSMTEPGSGSEWVDFVLELDECPFYLKTATATFSGTPDEHDATTYKNAGSAENVSLQLAAGMTNYGNGSTMKAMVDTATHKALFPLSARIYTPVGNTGKGSFNVVVGVDFTYQ